MCAYGGRIWQKFGVLEGYKHKEDVPDSEYLRLENQLSFPLYVVAKEIVNAYRNHFRSFKFDIYSIHRNDGIVANMVIYLLRNWAKYCA